MSDNLHEVFATKERALIVSPAGCGKTELIAKSVSTFREGRQLILTHTHAGVKSLKDRFKKLNVPSHLYRIDTIAGFALKYAVAFPKSSGVQNQKPADQQDWRNVYEAASRILSKSFVRQIVCTSYAGLFVDEYQDGIVA